VKIIKAFLFILFIIIFIFSIAYADPVTYEGEWITGTYSNVEGKIDKSHWEITNNSLSKQGVSESDIVNMYLTGNKVTIEKEYETSYFPQMTWSCGEGYCEGYYAWTHTVEGNEYIATISYERYYKAMGDLGSIIGLAGPAYIYVTEGISYNDFRVEVEETPGVTKTYTPEQICEWVEEFETIEATHGTITISKEPTYVFTKWHKLNDGTPAGMDLTISWNASKPIVNIEANMTVIRYQDMGEDFYEIYNDNPGSSSGVIEEHIEFEHAGTEESFLYIKFMTEEGNIGEITAPIPVNGFFGINLGKSPGPVDEIFKNSAADSETFDF